MIDYIKELSEFYGLDPKEIAPLIGDGTKFKKEWDERVKTTEDANKLYAETKSNLFRQCRMGLGARGRFLKIRRIVRGILDGENLEYLPALRRVLDHGCGIGDVGLALSGLGYEVDFQEIADSELKKFIEWRMAKRFLPCKFIGHNERLEKDAYDIIVSVDVLEHIDDVRKCLFDLHLALKSNGLFFLEYSWPERNYYKELGDLKADEEFIKPFMLEKFVKINNLLYIKKA